MLHLHFLDDSPVRQIDLIPEVVFYMASAHLVAQAFDELLRVSMLCRVIKDTTSSLSSKLESSSVIEDLLMELLTVVRIVSQPRSSRMNKNATRAYEKLTW